MPTTLKEIFNGGSRFRETITSKAAVLQSYWLDNLLVTTAGLRRDESDRFSPLTNFAYDTARADSYVKGFEDYNVYSFQEVKVGKEIKSYSAVRRWPQKLLRLPQGVDGSAFMNVSTNFTQGETIQTNIAPTAKAVIAALRPVWDELANKPRTNYPTGFVLGTPLPGSVETVGSFVSNTVYIPFATMLATEGSAAAEQRKYRANLVTNYQFSKESILGGWSVTAGIRWQSKLGIGYPAKFKADGSVDLGIGNPYYAPAETNVDLTISYGRKLWSNKIDWKASLQVRNAFASGGDFIPVTVQPTGQVASYRLAPEQRIYLTNSFSF
ncbi:MAG: hypothetical protein HY736_11495 [Verrucomicrobia bacterium]|nr:hypothetical protein [Verrucomicrobiota bacterium]